MTWIHHNFCLKNLILYYHRFSVKKVVFEDEDEYSPIDKLYNLINKKRRDLNSDLIQKHFTYQDLETMLESLDKTKNI